jgi:two-component system chemotaxis response regulator CheB
VKHELVVVGGSAGSFEALEKMLPRLSNRFRAALVIVLHQYKHRRGELASIVSRWSRLATVAVEDSAPVHPGRVHVCPANYHTLIEPGGTFALSTDALVSHARPSIDVLFESAARASAARVVGVLLSGGGTDGVAGLGAVKGAGGVTLCQDPASAAAPFLPESAKQAGVVDSFDDPARLGDRLEELCA